MLEVVLWEVNIHGHACDPVGITPLGVLQNLHYPIHAQLCTGSVAACCVKTADLLQNFIEIIEI